ncbi:MAG: HXXEE domain-containing protein [Cyclobacteriaceae bacterium]|nr:HXXEE domain-containing protein [Cyclobacteriaceae bacterium]
MTKTVSKLIILFPCTYVVHIAEEYWAGERFFNWLSRVANSNMTEDSFLLLNGVFMFIMIIATSIAIWQRDHRIVLVLASIVTINTLLHILGSIFTYSYSPGLISAVVLWLPLAAWAFYHERRYTSARQRLGAILAGIVAHVLVSVSALL